MKPPIEKLKEEHRNFRKLLDLLEMQLDLFHRREQPDYQLMTDILHYMTRYPDRFHHTREDVIFSCLLEHDPRMAKNVEELARQHHVITESGIRLHQNLESAIMGTMMPRQMIEAPGLQYVTYYRSHMDMEENVLFVSAERLLGDGEWKEIDSGTQAEPDPLFGRNVEARYCAVCRHIAQAVGGE